ncbi:pyridoxamine 5'-phosphate oxidase family protein [Pantoea coffeiphila]|uniref:Pyridoxamine 5'-phosphate oxidase N-terminal domain-containing protein n=1 Tax=Pantoea coffeiphila TaxID=1465635 RepID=A0A2S9I9G8_9GAMM|nr:pyridoxamine 5'-phosphate oxidase family protein [Pantoea coffeiphila]PRD14452.1 hypothetical protein CQW29_16505 [Pantoea coffeiphila]
MSPTERSLFLLQNCRFFTLASRPDTGEAWASTLNFVPAFSPVRLIWCSPKDARHSENIRQHPLVSGSMFRTDLESISPVGLDGAQFTGLCREIAPAEVAATHTYFSQMNFPDAQQRAAWMPPLQEFISEGARRFYEMKIAEWWLLDIDRWLETGLDKRLSLDLASVFDSTEFAEDKFRSCHK